MPSPTIGLDYTAAIHQSAGIGRYARELTASLADNLQSFPRERRPGRAIFRLFVAATRRADLPAPPPGCEWRPSRLSERNHARLWHRLRLPIPVEVWTGRLDLFHALDFTLPPTLPTTRTVLTVHDLSFEHYPEDAMPGMLNFLRSCVPRSARRADAIIAVSESTSRDLINLYHIPPEKITVIPHGVSPRFSPAGESLFPVASAEENRQRHIPSGPIVLSTGTLQPRKNHLRLVQALALMKERATLVIAGGQGWSYEAVHAEVARLRLGNRVTFAGFVDERDLPAVYRAATVFAYPALYEGFGLPVLEAMASGVAVLTSNTSSLPETAGDSALLVDPRDVPAIAQGLDRLIGDVALRAEFVRRGLARAAQFTWARAAEMTWGVYSRLLA